MIYKSFDATDALHHNIRFFFRQRQMRGYNSLLVLIATVGVCYADFVGNLTATGVTVVFPSSGVYSQDSEACK